MLRFIFVFLIVSTHSYGEKLEWLKEEYKSFVDNKYILLPHNRSFLLPFSYNSNPNTELYRSVVPSELQEDRGDLVKHLEAEFQISFSILGSKNVFYGHDLFMAYTQHSWWQVYNEKWSRPFRENNYAPELFLRKLMPVPYKFLGGHFVAYDVGYIHQSNGQIQELSRSWDRLYLRGIYVHDELIAKLMLWHRLSESVSIDDNPHMYRYVGYGSLELMFAEEDYDISFKIVPGERYYGAELSLALPINKGLKHYIRVGYGHGLSLQDYDHETRRVAIGVTMANPLNRIRKLQK